MKIYGIDFTSTPSDKKPITCADCTLENGFLHLNDLNNLESFKQFDDFLANETEWIAGMDFPFGQPSELINKWRLPLSWKEYVGVIDKWGKEKFEAKLNEYCQQRPKGKKHHKRDTDRIAKSISPMNIIRPPVGKMFFQGAPRLLKSGVSILPYYGFDVKLKEDFAAKMIHDHTGDYLDAFFCAIQAGWAYEQRETGYGIPKRYDHEGWIVDPDLYIILNSEKIL